jgi:hypothetical protein
MMDKVVPSTFSPSSTSTMISKSPVTPTNILKPRSTSSPVESLPIISSSPESITTPNIQSISPTLNSTIIVVDNTAETTEQMFFDLQNIEPIQSTMVDDHEIPSSTDATYAVLNAVDLNMSMLKPTTVSDVNSTPKVLDISSSILSKGKSK